MQTPKGAWFIGILTAQGAPWAVKIHQSDRLLEQAFNTYSIAIPQDEAAKHLTVPKTLTEAYETGVRAEIDNIAMYDRFLAQTLIQDPKYVDLKILFTNLRNASENHLRVFRNQLATCPTNS